MSVEVETLEKLERKITLTIAADAIKSEVEDRLRKIARSTKMDGFRPGKVPLSVVQNRYGSSVEYDVLNDRVSKAFTEAAIGANLRVAGSPTITDKTPEVHAGQYIFDAVFEIFPDVVIGDISTLELEKSTCQADDTAVDRTIDILRKQRRTFTQRSLESAAAEGDRVTVNFEGKIDGEPFEGGADSDFKFIVGEGQMLKEFEAAVQGMAVGESKTFPLAFPENYHGKEVAGKTADFLVTVKNIEESHLPAIDDALAKALNVKEGTLEALRADIQRNLVREIDARLLMRNKKVAFDGLVSIAQLDLPKSLVENEMQRMASEMMENLKAKGVKEMNKSLFPPDIFREGAESRVRLGLVVSELIKQQQLKSTPEQIDARLKEIAASYEDPTEVVQWYKENQKRLEEIENSVLQSNVTDFVFSHSKVTTKEVGFEELMSQG